MTLLGAIASLTLFVLEFSLGFPTVWHGYTRLKMGRKYGTGSVLLCEDSCEVGSGSWPSETLPLFFGLVGVLFERICLRVSFGLILDASWSATYQHSWAPSCK